MIRQRVSLAVVGAVVAGTALSTGLVSPASAASSYDPGFTPSVNDLVGVGSDTIEIVMHDVATAYNQTDDADSGRIASFAAAPAENITIRDGVTIARPNGSGPGKSALYGSTNQSGVSFARSSSSLSPTETSAGLRQYAFAVDGLRLAVSSANTHAPSTITAADMVNIYNGTYKTWGQIPGYDGTAPSATIKPYQPQSGSGTLSFFTAQLTAANGGVAVNLGQSVLPSQEHDASVLANDPDAIAPFSTARAKGLSSVKLVRGFQARRAVYNVVRGSDVDNDKIKAVFGPDGYLCSAAAKPAIEAAGFDQLATSATSGGQCGIATQAAVAFPYVTSSVVTTETSLTATAAGGTVTLKAAVSGNNIASGNVVFKQAGATIGTVAVNGQSTATLTLPGVAKGAQTYTASFVPANNKFVASDSLPTTVKVVTASTASVSPVRTAYGVATTIPVQVSSAGGPVSGSVSVNVGGVVSTVALVNGAGAAAVPATLRAGTYPVTATFAGDGSTGASSASSSLTVTAAKTASTLKLAQKKAKAGKTLKTTVTVKVSGSPVRANGKVTLKVGSKTIGKGTVKNGKVTITLKKLKKGSYKIKAVFAGDSNLSGSTSKTVKLKVVK
ncbi:MAG: Ig-like domain repeat protein [Aeromicrobium sp.]